MFLVSLNSAQAKEKKDTLLKNHLLSKQKKWDPRNHKTSDTHSNYARYGCQAPFAVLRLEVYTHPHTHTLILACHKKWAAGERRRPEPVTRPDWGCW